MENVILILMAFLLGIPCAYIVWCLRLDELDDHEGPFILKNTFVIFSHNKHIQKAGLFDIIRLWFGVYVVEKDGSIQKWVVDPSRSEYFTCEVCLSFWIAIPFTLYLLISFPTAFPLLVFTHFGISYISSILVRVLDKMGE